jgi:hypothetical protein
MRGVISPLPNTSYWHDAQLKHRDNFTFTWFTATENVSGVWNYITMFHSYVTKAINFRVAKAD